METTTPRGRVKVAGKARNLRCVEREFHQALTKARALRAVLVANGFTLEPLGPLPNATGPRKPKRAVSCPVEPPALQVWAVDAHPEVAPSWARWKALHGPFAGDHVPGWREARTAYLLAAYGTATDAGVRRLNAKRFSKFARVSVSDTPPA